ncbi:MAG: aminopeptidase P family N-terminal domain-containing protein, partial [Candidatus Bathyarchaeia archaeon]
MSVDYDKLNKERLRSASQVVKKLDLDALVATAFDNVRYLTGRRAFFVTGWEPNAVAILTKEGEVFFQHADEYVAPSPIWRNKAAALRKERFWFNYSTFNPTIVSDMWVQWLVKSLDNLGVRKGRIGLDRSPWQWYAEIRNKRPELEIVNAEEDLLLARAVKNSE